MLEWGALIVSLETYDLISQLNLLLGYTFILHCLSMFWGCERVYAVHMYTYGYHGPGVSLYLLHEDTGRPKLPRVKLAQKAHTSV